MSNTTTTPAVFQFHTHQVRTIVRDGAPWFVASDVCAALEYANSRDAVATHLDDDERMTVANGDSHSGKRGGARLTTIINESGLYALVLRSRKPEARKFAKWVTSEVLPAIRKTGEYRTPYVAGPNDVLTAAQAEQLRIALKAKCDTLPKDKQGAFMLKAWSKLKSHFGCSYRKIPQREYSEALSLVARHSTEWELLDAPAEQPAQAAMQFTYSATPRDVHTVDSIEGKIKIRAFELAHLFYEKFVSDMHSGSQFHYFMTGDNQPENWMPSMAAPDAAQRFRKEAAMALFHAEEIERIDADMMALMKSAGSDRWVSGGKMQSGAQP